MRSCPDREASTRAENSPRATTSSSTTGTTRVGCSTVSILGFLHFVGATKPWSASPEWEYRHATILRQAWHALAASDHPAPLAAGFSTFCAAAARAKVP